MNMAVWIFAIAGPALIAIAALRWARRGQADPRCRAWLIVGGIFTSVALWIGMSR
ncbi:MAG: hypothetical protein H7Z15_14765 [Rhizobacter sp.]|nr:hypothetical protein [Rhizobacter sp.]